jgi:hypothetical protein
MGVKVLEKSYGAIGFVLSSVAFEFIVENCADKNLWTKKNIIRSM